MSSIWGDPAKQYADYTMAQIQGLAGNTPDGRNRGTAPYYTFGALEFERQTPPTQLPAVQWRQSTGRFDYCHVAGGAGTTGSLGSWIMDLEVKCYGNDRDEAFDQALFIMWAVFGLQNPNPPISDFRGEWAPLGAQNNHKETLVLSFTAPFLVPQVPTTQAIVQAISSSYAVAAISGSALPPVTGSYAVDNVSVITGSA